MGSSEDVKQRIPGLKFNVVKHGYTGSLRPSVKRGEIHLGCEFTERDLFDRAVEKLDGFKMFSTVAEEFEAALSHELDSTNSELRQAQDRCRELEQELVSKDETIAQLRGVLAKLEADLGIVG